MVRGMRKRYLAIKAVGEQPVDGRDIMDAIWGALLQLFGEHGASQANLSLIAYDPQKHYATLRCSHKTVEMVRASIASVTKIEGKPAVIRVLGVSGTLKALQKKVLLQN